MTDELERSSAGEPVIPPPAPVPAPGGPDGSLLAILDRLTALLERSDLTEIEVESGGTGLILRKVVAVAPAAAPVGPATAAVGSPSSPNDGGQATALEAPPGRPSVKAPLTGIFYASPGPGSAAYVQVGGEVAVGQVIGLIEAMKLFNEIRSTKTGKVRRIIADNGQLVRAHAPLIELDPA